MVGVSTRSKPASRANQERVPRKRQARKRSPLGTIKSWHWISSAVCLVATLGFAITGITLNHANKVEADASKTVYEMALPDSVQQVLATRQNELLLGKSQAESPLPSVFKQWYREQPFGSRLRSINAEWDEYEVYVGLPH